MGAADSITIRLHRPQPTGDYALDLHLWQNGLPNANAVKSETISASKFATNSSLDPVAVAARLDKATGAAPWLKDVGRELYDILHTGSVGQEWDKILAKRKQDQQQWDALPKPQPQPRPPDYRTLLAVEDMALRSLPWELAQQ